ncbi:metallophosphoesterase family protein [Saccharomonospora sp. NPDC046836]|uniref:metallophosphoesterase family protein n=1 Tax=Saccharomonospora sp. NPDC046836 TaxID=3156921 RepID=UPI0033DFF26B
MPVSRASGWGVVASVAAVLAGSVLIAQPSAADDSYAATDDPSQISMLSGPEGSGPVSMRFSWVTEPDVTDTVIEYATKESFADTGEFADRAEGRWERADINVATSRPVNGHKVEIEGLLPSTEYVYRVGDGDAHMSDVHGFTTRDAEVGEFAFHWYTDAQMNDYEGYADTLIPAMDRAFREAPDPAFMLFTGDQVNHSYKSEQWDGFFRALQSRSTSVPTYFTIGNHEYEGNPDDGYLDWESPDPYFTNFAARTNIPPNGPAYFGAADGKPTAVGEEAKTLRNTAYYFEHGDALFIVLNHFDQLDDAALQPQLDWLKTVVQASDAKWKIAAYHHGPYLGRRNHPSNYRDIAKAFDEAGIDLSLSGHDGMYLRTNPLKDDVVVGDGEGTTYVTGAAVGDGQGYTWNPDIAGRYTAVYKDNQESSYQTVSVSPEKISITSTSRDPKTKAYSVNDTFEITKALTPSLDDWVPPPAPEQVHDEDYPPLVDGTYEISTAAQLMYLSNNLGNGFDKLPADGDYRLTADIDLQRLRGFRPLGLSSGFTGTFDGNGHTISNLYLDYDQGWELDHQPAASGFVARLGEGGRVRDLGLARVEYRDAEGAVGGVAGIVDGGEIERVYVTGTVESTQDTAGGIVGVLAGGGVADSYSTVHLDGSATAGGLVGEIPAGATATVERSLVTGAVVTTRELAGGAIGRLASASGRIHDTVAANRLITGTNAGALVGQADDAARVDNNVVWADVPVTGTQTEQRGVTELTEPDFIAESTYRDLGWDFETVWAWQPATPAHPLLAGISSQLNPLPFTNKDALADLVATVTGENAPDEAGYTRYSYRFLLDAIDAGRTVLASPLASQTEVDQAHDRLRAAIEFLNPISAERQYKAGSIAELRYRIAEIGDGEEDVWLTRDFDADDAGGPLRFEQGAVRLRAETPTTLRVRGNVYVAVSGAELTVGPNVTLLQDAENTARAAFVRVSSGGHLGVEDATIDSDATMSGSQGVIVTDGSRESVTIERSRVSGVGARTIYAYSAGPLFTITDSTITNTNTALYRSHYVLGGKTVIEGSIGGGAVLHDFRDSAVEATADGNVVTLAKSGTGPAVSDPAYAISYVVSEGALGDFGDPVPYTGPITVPAGSTVHAALTHQGFHGPVASFTVPAEPTCRPPGPPSHKPGPPTDKPGPPICKPQR